jgi:hypothetical protein
MIWAGMPRIVLRSVGWVPLAAAIGFGFFTPPGLIHWLNVLAMGHP